MGLDLGDSRTQICFDLNLYTSKHTLCTYLNQHQLIQMVKYCLSISSGSTGTLVMIKCFIHFC